MADDPEKKDKLEDILYPSSKAKSFRVTIAFGAKTSPAYKKAVALAKRNPTYKEEGNGKWIPSFRGLYVRRCRRPV